MSKQLDCIIEAIQNTTVPEVAVGSMIGGMFGLLGGALVGTLTSLQAPTELAPRLFTGAAIGAPVGAILFNAEVIRESTNECMEK